MLWRKYRDRVESACALSLPIWSSSRPRPGPSLCRNYLRRDYTNPRRIYLRWIRKPILKFKTMRKSDCNHAWWRRSRDRFENRNLIEQVFAKPERCLRKTAAHCRDHLRRDCSSLRYLRCRRIVSKIFELCVNPIVVMHRDRGGARSILKPESDRADLRQA
jgi:hypothetical protein